MYAKYVGVWSRRECTTAQDVIAVFYVWIIIAYGWLIVSDSVILSFSLTLRSILRYTAYTHL